MLVKPPSQRLPHPSDYYYYFEREGSVWSNDMIMTDDNPLRDVRDLTQSLNFNTSRYTHSAPSITFISPKLTEILSRFRQLTDTAMHENNSNMVNNSRRVSSNGRVDIRH